MSNLMAEWKFKRDTAFRKQFFVPDSFAHPAKMDAQLLIRIVETYTEPGETILDPMAGSGTAMLACTLGRNVILVELEEKFIKMCRDNWGQVRMRPQLGYTMGGCVIMQGDARQLENILCDKIITSPPYAKSTIANKDWEQQEKQINALIKAQRARGVNYSREAAIHSIQTQQAKLPDNPDNIGNLPYGQLEGLLVDKCIFSPPYAEAQGITGAASSQNIFAAKIADDVIRKRKSGKMGGHFASKEAIEKAAAKRQLTPDDPNNIGNLPYGAIDKIVTSPPYAEMTSSLREDKLSSGFQSEKAKKIIEGSIGAYSDNKENIGNLPYGEIDKIITSPPYEAAVTGKDGIDWSKGTRGKAEGNKPRDRSKEPAFNHLSIGGAGFAYSGSKDNIGNLKSDTYLEAMLQVYQQCYRVLKPQGLMILVTKNFIRNKQMVRLDLDTIKLCEQTGFSFVERRYRKLPSQSFWRIIYYQKHPDVPVIDREDVLVFRK
jgi:DNA modification methylase